MKTRIYQLLKYLTVLTLLLTFVNCNKEQPEDEILMEQVVKPKYVLKKITYDDYSKNKYLSNKLDAINKKDSNPLRGSREESSEDKYYLNLNEATYIEDAENNFHSYTFSVNSADEESSIIENVILVSTTSEEYKAYLTTYNLTEEEKEKIINGEVVDLEGKASLKPIESNQIITFGIGDSGCYEFKEVPGEWEDCEHSNHQNAHEVNGFCDHPTAVIDWVEVDCRQESGGGGDPTNNGSTSAGTTTGGSSHNTGSLSTAITSLTFNDGSTIASYLTSHLQLNTLESRFLSRNSDLANNIQHFLVDNENTKEAKDFATYHIKSSMKTILTNQTTRAQLLSEIKLKTSAIVRYGLPNDKQLGLYFKELNTQNSDFSEFSFKELYDYYALIYNSHFKMQLNRVKHIVITAIVTFKPVIEFALMEVGGTITLKLLQKLPASIITTPLQKIISKLKFSTSQAFSNLKHAKKYGITSYKGLKGTFKELGLSAKAEGVEFHHLFEQRFVNQLKNKLGSNTDDWLSIVVEKGVTGSEHYKFTQAWKKAIGYEKQSVGWTGKTTETAKIIDIERAAKKIYEDYPELLKALGL